MLLNGNSHGFIKPERGIRQDDLLSPSIFILWAEALVSYLNMSEEADRFHGIKLADEFSLQMKSLRYIIFYSQTIVYFYARPTPRKLKKL